MKQYQVITMVPVSSVVVAPTPEIAKKKADAISRSFSPVESKITGNKLIKPILLGIKELKYVPPQQRDNDDTPAA